MMAVFQRQRLAEDFQRGRETRRGDAFGIVAHQCFAGEKEQVRVFAFGALTPLGQRDEVDDVFGKVGVVKGFNEAVVDQYVGAAGFLFQPFNFRDQFLVVLQKGHPRAGGGVDFTGNQTFADEQGAAQGGVDVAVGYAAAGIDGQAVHRAARQRARGAL